MFSIVNCQFSTVHCTLFPHPLNNFAFIHAALRGAEVKAKYLCKDGAQYAQHVNDYIFYFRFNGFVAENNDIEQHESEYRSGDSQVRTNVFG
jgi:hypothetical protein